MSYTFPATQILNHIHPILPHGTATAVLTWGVIVHLVADWIFQNDYLARYKTSLRHPAAWIHSGIHLFALLFLFPPVYAMGLAATHILIDTRIPLKWWRRVVAQTEIVGATNYSPERYEQHLQDIFAVSVSFWADQVLHLLLIAIAALIWKGVS